MDQTLTQPLRSETTERRINTLTLLVIGYLLAATNPFLIRLPLFGGRSLTLIFMAFIALEVLSKEEPPEKGSLHPWTWLLVMINAGLLFSFWANLFRTDMDLDFSLGLRIFFGNWYWIVMAIIIMRLAMQPEYLRLMVITLGVGAIMLGGFRVYEALRSGGWGVAGTTGEAPTLASKNGYGLLFSNFALFALLLPLVFKGPWRIASIGGIIVLVFAILGTGSRGSWAGLGIGAAVFIVLYGIAQNTNRIGLVFIVGAILWFVVAGPLPASVEQVIEVQSSTLAALNEDESYAYRQLMNQKSQLLIEQHPLFGVGIGQFKQTPVEGLVIPTALRGFSSEDLLGNSAHNSYLFLFAEGGLVTMLPYALLLGLLLIEGGKTSLQQVRKGEMWIVPVYASFISVSIHLWGLSGLETTGPWLIYGLLAGIILNHRTIAPPPVALPYTNPARNVTPILPTTPTPPQERSRRS